MKFELINCMENFEMYGDIPCLPTNIQNGEGERFVGTESDSWILLDDFVSSIDKICPNLLDYGDVDFFDSDKCLILRKWLAQRKTKPMSHRLKELYDYLEYFINRAIELDTGIIIGL